MIILKQINSKYTYEKHDNIVKIQLFINFIILSSLASFFPQLFAIYPSSYLVFDCEFPS